MKPRDHLNKALKQNGELNLAVIFHACHTLGVSTIEIQFDGYDNDETCERIIFEPKPSVDLAAYRIPQHDIKYNNGADPRASIGGSIKPLDEAIEDYFTTYHTEHGINFQDEGCSGKMYFDVATAEVKVELIGTSVLMDRVEISGLSNAALDYAVALVYLPYPDFLVENRLTYVQSGDEEAQFSPSSDWNIGGPILSDHKIQLVIQGNSWHAIQPENAHPATPKTVSGDHPLEAAMRMFAISQLGETAMIPRELLECVTDAPAPRREKQAA